MIRKPNTSYYAIFTTTSPHTGMVRDADSTPTAVAVKNGADDGAFSLTITKLDSGRYRVSGTIPNYSASDSVQIVATATVEGITEKLVVDSFIIDTKITSDLKDFDYTNQACILTSDYNAAKTAATQSSVNELMSDVASIKSAIENATYGLSALKSELLAISAKTVNLPSDPASASVISSAFSTINNYVDEIEGLLKNGVYGLSELKTAITAIPTNPLLTNDSRIEALADIKNTTDKLQFDAENFLKTHPQKGQFLLPIMQLNVSQPEYRLKRTVNIIRNDNPSIPFYLERDCTDWNGRFGAKRHIDDTEYAMPVRDIRWSDASKGFGSKYLATKGYGYRYVLILDFHPFFGTLAEVRDFTTVACPIERFSYKQALDLITLGGARSFKSMVSYINKTTRAPKKLFTTMALNAKLLSKEEYEDK